MNNKKIYIAGLMTGLTEEQIKAKFSAMQEAMERNGYEVVNPLCAVDDLNFSRTEYDLPPLTEADHRRQILGFLMWELSGCDELHLMPCWQQSKGAQLERHFAQSVGITIVYHSSIPPKDEAFAEMFIQEVSESFKASLHIYT